MSDDNNEFDAAAHRELYVKHAGLDKSDPPADPPKKLLFVVGQIKGRNENYSKSQTYYLHNSIDYWIRDSGKASGNKQLIVNYLLKRGIEALEAENEMIILEDFEGI